MATTEGAAGRETTFCLMHSSGQGPQGWELLVDELQRRGHRALTPVFDVTKTDEGAEFHAKTIIDALRESGQRPADVICVAHSAAGIYLPIVGERWRPRRMVFLAALIPQPGHSIIEQFNADPSMFNPAWVGKNPMDDGVALEFVYHDCPTDRIEWALSTRVLFYAKQAMQEQCPLSDWPSVPASYIACLDDRTIAPAWQMRAAREWLNVEPFVLPGGHCPNVSRPEALAEVLVKIGLENNPSCLTAKGRVAEHDRSGPKEAVPDVQTAEEKAPAQARPSASRPRTVQSGGTQYPHINQRSA